jgi:RimJ/RimL family protein N-acetyltransferase
MPARRDGSEPVIAHGSVYLRGPEREDIPRFVAWLNDWRTSRTLALRAPLSIPLEEAWFERMIADQGKGGYLFVTCLLADDRPVGDIGLFDLDLVNGSAGLGILIGEAGDRGRGLGTDALRAMLGFSFGLLRLERVWLDVYDFNPGARRLYERVGFVHEGVLRRAVFREGRYVDVHRMAILADEWRATLRDARAAEPAAANRAAPGERAAR